MAAENCTFAAVENCTLSTFDIADPAFTIEHNDQLISFDFAAMEFAAPRKIQYQHRLTGFDSDWVSDGNNSRATYTNLSPGDYVFEARAARESDAWGESIRVGHRKNNRPKHGDLEVVRW